MTKSKLYVKLDWLSWNNDKGKCHREDGPAAVYSDGTKYWFLNGLRHREDGPAVEHSGGIKYWYLKGFNYTEKEHYAKIKTLR